MKFKRYDLFLLEKVKKKLAETPNLPLYKLALYLDVNPAKLKTFLQKHNIFFPIIKNSSSLRPSASGCGNNQIQIIRTLII